MEGTQTRTQCHPGRVVPFKTCACGLELEFWRAVAEYQRGILVDLQREHNAIRVAASRRGRVRQIVVRVLIVALSIFLIGAMWGISPWGMPWGR